MIRDFFCIQFRHDLHEQRPFREITAFNGIVKVSLAAFTVTTNQFCCFCIGQVLNALLSAEVEFHPETLIIGINKTIGVATKTMHVTITHRNTTIRHHNGDLVQCFWQQSPEIPVIGRITQVGAWVTLYRFIQVRELTWVAEKEHWCVVTD